MTETPQIYLITPPSFSVETFAQDLARLLDATEIACLRLQMAGADVDEISRAADHLRDIAHQRDVPLVIAEHSQLVEKLGLDGVHLTDARGLRDLRKSFGGEPIIGAYCKASRHDGMSAGEAGADYIGFGPVGASALGSGEIAEAELFAWWSEMIELPVVAEGGLTEAQIATLAPVVDFFAIGAEIWASDAPLDALNRLLAPL